MPRARSLSMASASSSTTSELGTREYHTGPLYADPFASDDEMELTPRRNRHRQVNNLDNRPATDEANADGNDFEGEGQEEDELPGLSDSDSEHGSDSGSVEAWQPPDPEDEMLTEDGANRLLAFQRLPGEAQVHVIYLHQVEDVPIPRAIDEVVTEQRLRLHESPIQARQARTVALRLTLERVNENLFNQWLRLSILVQALPAKKQETGRRVLRLVSDDPRSFKNVYQATRAAANLNNPFVNRVLRDLSDNAASYHRNNEDLRGLSRYDRHRAPSDPEPVDGPPDGIPTAGNLMDNERRLHKSAMEMKLALQKYRKLLDCVMEGVFASLCDYDDEPDIEELLQLATEWWNSEDLTDEEVAQRVLDCGFSSPAWDDPETCDSPCMLLGAFFKCTLGTHDRPTYLLLSQIADWEQWGIGSPGAVADQATQQLMDMEGELLRFFDESKSVLIGEIKDLGPGSFRALRNQLLHELQHGSESARFTELRYGMADDIVTWPSTVRNRTFAVCILWAAKESLARLTCATDAVATSLANLGDFLPEPEESLKPAFHMYNRAMRRGHLVRGLSEFNAYHYQAVREFRVLAKSCRHPRARTLILEAIPESGYGANLERARDIATAANVQEPILDSADMLWKQQLRIVDLSSRIRSHEKAHLTHLYRLFMDDIESILSFALMEKSQTSDRETLADSVPALFLHYHGCPAFGPALREVLAPPDDRDNDYEIISLLSTAALLRPLEEVLELLRKHGRDSKGTYIPSEAARLLAQLHIRFLYLGYGESLVTRLDAARFLTRHCWHFGLHRAWMDWAAEARVLVEATLDCLPPDEECGCCPPDESREKVLTRRLFWALMEPDKDYGEIEKALAQEESFVPEGLKDGFFEHVEKLNVLRKATVNYLKRRDMVDPYVLPEGFAVSDPRPAVQDRDAPSVEWLHQMIRFDKSVLDGGNALPDASDWEHCHNDRLDKWGLI